MLDFAFISSTAKINNVLDPEAAFTLGSSSY